MVKDYKKITITIGFVSILILMLLTTYATVTEITKKGVITKVIKIDEDAYGEFAFDSSNLNFTPMLDSEVSSLSNKVIYMNFRVGGSELNTAENIIYDIALVDLQVDCNLLSPYLKWQLFKNGKIISTGSLDYKFDTIKNGRLVLTPIQQDLKKFSEDKNTYDYYEFYMWISDSFQEEDLSNYNGEEEQNDLIGKRIKGKIEVELYGEEKSALVRTPSEELNTETCMIENITTEEVIPS